MLDTYSAGFRVSYDRLKWFQIQRKKKNGFSTIYFISVWKATKVQLLPTLAVMRFVSFHANSFTVKYHVFLFVCLFFL